MNSRRGNVALSGNVEELMPIFRVKIAGRSKPILARADSAAKVREAIVEAKALTSKELSDAFGEAVWTPGEELPAEPAAGEQTAEPAADAD